MLGREVNLPIDILYSRPSSQEPLESHEYVAQLRERMEHCLDMARDCLKKSAIRQKRDYDSRISENNYKPGQLVYRRTHNRKKLEKPWQGLYVVIKFLGDVVYQVTDKRKAVVLHHDMLKPYIHQNLCQIGLGNSASK